ncbi:uncharacterized protein SAMN04515674_105163 [Pseudarcicella hirudinis]|uniref:DUF418 domain-containing protein n=1 Tax=Pseudarcicella hirudinis TaxID=1079859 RepID=A0A1I5SQX1_9BACT|nr:DUF418 domain-containing protein [Pseudarcicella hirudinis]SFP73192.1 uncharacterized protein SAMN04515674_105163 [Pseudarcicella hirudinis]
MQQGQASLWPIEKTERIQSIDMIRGVALLGILLMNIESFGYFHEYVENPVIYGGTSGINYWVWWVITVVFEGKMRGLFSMLFGASVILLTSKKETEGLSVADVYYRRLLWLLVFGLINAYILLWPGDILYAYAICGLFLFPFRKMKPVYLIICGVLFLCKDVVQSQMEFQERKELRREYVETQKLQKTGKKLSEKQKQSVQKWEEFEKSTRFDPKKIKENDALMLSGYGTIFGFCFKLNQELQSSEFYNETFWDCIGMMLIGMGLMKIGVFSGKLKTKEYLWLMLIGYGIGIPMGIFVAFQELSFFRDAVAFIDLNTIDTVSATYEPRRLFITAGHVGLLMLIFKSGWFKGFAKVLSSVGQMAFTNYLMQSVLCTLFFYGYGLGYFGKLQRYELYLVVLSVWIIQLIWSNIWLRNFRLGPLEWLWKSLTYARKQPIR